MIEKFAGRVNSNIASGVDPRVCARAGRSLGGFASCSTAFGRDRSGLAAVPSCGDAPGEEERGGYREAQRQEIIVSGELQPGRRGPARDDGEHGAGRIEPELSGEKPEE